MFLADSMVGDRSTPDRAVTSYWRFRAIEDSIGAIVDSASWGFRQWEQNKSARRRFFAGPALEEIDEPQVTATYSREIIDVDQQTETRAVVTTRVRNTTPIPAGATPTEYDVERRREGNRHRYILEKFGDGWKIVQMQTWEEYSESWRDIFGGPPHVPSWTNP